jgi:YidC/Oxa1 family membrane protein insertase
MDKQSIIGIVIIGVILLGYTIFSTPNAEERAELERKRDSIIQVQRTRDSLALIELENATKNNLTSLPDSLISNSSNPSDSIKLKQYQDSIRQLENKNRYGILAEAANGQSEIITLENKHMIAKFNTKGGKIHSVELKNYKTHDGNPLILFEGDTAVQFGYEMMVDNRPINTNDMYFKYMGEESELIVPENDSTEITFRLYAGDNSYIENVYRLSSNDWMMNFSTRLVNMNEILARNINYIQLHWNAKLPQLEKGRKWETQNTTIHYRFSDGSIEKLNERKDEDKASSAGNVNWVAYKQQFFSSILVCDETFEEPVFTSKTFETGDFIQEFNSSLTLPYLHEAERNYDMQFYFGPNKYSILKSYDQDMESLIPLGRSVFRWVNKFMIIPMFNWLGNWIGNYGIIILIMTILIKLVLFPLTYKSYMSMAKMRVLKPQIDELSKKYPKGKEAEKQQATMALYRRAGVNPMGGCLPMLLQMPILIALFRFFPASIELRQQSFLWADDLSSYDSILNLPFEIPMYGDHVSLFTLLMAISMIISTKLNNANQASGPNQATMKMMVWFMPIMLLVIFNSYSSGLSYYYFLANLITIAQTWIIREYIVDEEAVLNKLEANKKKAPKSKSKWQQRLEEAAKQRGYQAPKR